MGGCGGWLSGIKELQTHQGTVDALSSNSLTGQGPILPSWHPSQHEGGQAAAERRQQCPASRLPHPTCRAGVGAIEGIIEAALAPIHAASALRRRSPLGRRSPRLLAGRGQPRGCSCTCLATATLQGTTMLAETPV